MLVSGEKVKVWAGKPGNDPRGGAGMGEEWTSQVPLSVTLGCDQGPELGAMSRACL